MDAIDYFAVLGKKNGPLNCKTFYNFNGTLPSEIWNDAITDVCVVNSGILFILIFKYFK